MTTELKALDVAQSILYIAHQAGDNITNLKLQKLLYYAQAWYLVNFDKPLFEDNIEAWQYGPVVREVYITFNKYQNKPISKFDKKAIDKLTAEQVDYLKEFCAYFMKFSASELVSMTHSEQPWIEAFEQGAQTVISIETMKTYYNGLKNATI